MTRDMELIRKIVLAIQSWGDHRVRLLEIAGYDPNVVGRHVQMLIEAGYVDGKAHHSSMGRTLTGFVSDLTWEGHDFAAAIQNEGIWAKFKQSVSPAQLAQMPLPMIKKLGLSLLEASLKNQLGL